MKRHTSLIRKILEYVEAKTSDEWACAPEFRCFDPQQTHYHIRLCEEAGYITAQRVGGSGFDHYAVGVLTWIGHETLDDLVVGSVSV